MIYLTNDLLILNWGQIDPFKKIRPIFIDFYLKEPIFIELEFGAKKKKEQTGRKKIDSYKHMCRI